MKHPYLHSKSGKVCVLRLLFFLLTTKSYAQTSFPQWSYRKTIIINQGKVGAGTHANFPVLINITDANLKSSAQTDGDDIFFTLSDGSTKLEHEIESYTSAAGALVAWVKIPSLASTSNTVIYMYYGNSSAVSQQSVSGTWDASFKGVWHMNSAFTDATSNYNHGTNTGTTGTTGKIAGGREFDQSNGTDYITVPGLMGSQANVTLSGWAYLDSRDATGAHLISIGNKATINMDDVSEGTTGSYKKANNSWTVTAASPVANYAGTGWHYVVYTANDAGNAQVLYVDGAVKATSSANQSILYTGSGTNTFIGKHADGSTNYDFDGKIDEVRVAGSARSAGWVLTEYNNQNSPSAFYNIGNQTCNSTSVTWTGNISANWNDAANWACYSVPTAATDVLIPAQANLPFITSDTLEVKNLTIQTGASLTINSTLEVAGTITNSGSISADNGTLIMNGTSAQVIPAGLFVGNTLKNLVINNSAGVSLAGALRITDMVLFGNVNNSVFNTGGFLTLVSTSTSTSQLADITNNGNNSGNAINGNVTIERHFQSRRAYRFLTAPVNSSGSIRANWMENTNNATTSTNNNPAAGYGTHITGSGGNLNGFDATLTNNSSLFTFNNQTQAWMNVGSTSSPIKAGSPYRIMIRGSRGTNLSDNLSASSVTTLRATGTLVTGPVVLAKAGAGGTAGMPELSASINGYSFIANPYAAVVDWKQVIKTDVSKTLYYYDPTISGSNGRGAYITYNEVLGVVSNQTSLVDNNIQSGQAFFVQTTGPNPSLTFEEKYKASSRKAIFRPATDLPHLFVKLLLPRQENTNESADGFAAYFSNDFDSSIGDEDSYKFSNLDENIAILRNGKTLSIEGRKLIASADTLPIKIWQLTQSRYLLKINVSNFAENVAGYLEDAYLKSSTLLTPNAETTVSFSINSDRASIATDRFRIVFETFATLPVQITRVKATEKSKGVLVEWTAESEANMGDYLVERSANLYNFITVGSLKAKHNSELKSLYSWFDGLPPTGYNYYRIKSSDKSGEIKYSEVVRVQVKNVLATKSVSASALSASNIKITFKNMEKGTYKVGLINNAGQTLYTGTISHSGESAATNFNTRVSIGAGIYNVQLSRGGDVYNMPVWIK